MDPDQQLRNLKDFLLVYNRMTEICFQRCTSNFNYRNLTMDEGRCVDSCAGKLIRSNHRLMSTYVQLMPRMVQRRMEEMEKAAENVKAAEAAASASAAPPAAETLPESQSLITSSPSPQIPPLTDVTPEAFGSTVQPAGSDILVGLDAVVPAPMAEPEVKLSAAAPITPVTEVVNLPVLNEAGNGLSNTGGFPLPPIGGVQNESGISAPVFVSSEPTSASAAVPVSTVAAPTVSLSSESKPLSGQERPPEVLPQSGQQ
ncbi:mitochondrial import inner membrane translocase subunit Tim10 B [Halichoeres trimaculatus]|uniref:mitochondrial import inner membrane translocase subunit Tim10 B n=1 Tax=Halichoeres trimaculatus TaxID=147232 RepID=UPI003D9F734E